MQNFLEVLKADGIAVEDDALELWSTPEEEKAAAELLAGAGVKPGDRLVAFHPFASVPQKRWNLEEFAALARLFKGQNLTVLLLGAPSDRETLDSVRELSLQNVDLVGKCSLRDAGMRRLK